ncbi:hypothetical protein GPECTOR_9g456 [Gonium pectorale]|uniref:AB hydrolase-1 domain-containing protein n=1 Tax=Gonium pectorale TaxID=33097 RepID=A0A150GRM6_GONPE|nr:hypothetical protein GPECTOR_9g456 [Gonium pectorale]|eukprot:KXZ52412.1 hypothetical protein GPECTOR_9g456 [Gonium pectorale]
MCSMELWRDLLLDFMAEFTEGKPAVLVGNSIGALACLMANAASPRGSVRGTVLLNSAGAMNNKGVIGDWRIVAVYPLLLFIDFLLSIPAVSAALFNNFRTKDNILQVLKNGVYSNPAAVDSALVDEIYAPSCDPGAREVFVSVITGPPGPKPWSLMPDVQGQLLVLWGDKDTLTPVDGPVGRYLQALQGTRPGTTFKMLQDVGHCLHDDKPELVHAELLPWLERLMEGQPNCEAPAAAVAQAAEPAVEPAKAAAAVVEEAAVAAAAVATVAVEQLVAAVVASAEPAAEAVEEPAVEAVVEPAAEAVAEPAAEAVAEPAAVAVAEPAVEAVAEPAAVAVVEPAAEAVAEPAVAAEAPVAASVAAEAAAEKQAKAPVAAAVVEAAEALAVETVVGNDEPVEAQAEALVAEAEKAPAKAAVLPAVTQVVAAVAVEAAAAEAHE